MTAPSQSRGRFSGYVLMDALQEAEEAHAQGRELHPHLLSDWNRFIGEQFELDEEQRGDLDRMCANPDTAIQEAVLRALSTPGQTPHFTLDRRPDESSPGGFYNQLSLQHTAESGAGAGQQLHNLAIAHCDANCRNWQWG